MSLLKPNQLPLLHFVRFKGRPARNKLKIPEDKSNVILGRWKPSIAFPKPGVSDKAVRLIVFMATLYRFLLQNPIHVTWDRPIMIQTVNPKISGDVGGLEHFGIDKLDLSQPRADLEKSKSLR